MQSMRTYLPAEHGSPGELFNKFRFDRKNELSAIPTRQRQKPGEGPAIVIPILGIFPSAFGIRPWDLSSYFAAVGFSPRNCRRQCNETRCFTQARRNLLVV